MPARDLARHLRLGRRACSTPSRTCRTTRSSSTSSASSGCGASSTCEGRREINELHVPVGRRVKLTMTSRGRDPQLLRARVPREAGRAARPLHPLWFEATKPGALPPVLRRVLRDRPLGHGRLGLVIEPAEFQEWLAGVPSGGRSRPRARQLFEQLRAATPAMPRRRRKPRSRARRRSSAATVPLADGGTVVADENYLRESILDPQAKIVAGLRGPREHADLPGTGQRGAAPAAHRIHQVAWAAEPAGTPSRARPP